MSTKTDQIDIEFMQVALGLARRELGNTHSNPAVGCVLVRPDLNQRVVGRGWTKASGRPHAETVALEQAGALAKGSTAYVTLEPCCHQGQTPPCSDALIKAGIKRAVIAMQDPDPRVLGQGIEALKKAGIEVLADVCESDAANLNAGFLSRIIRQRPYITFKSATTVDGKIATVSGNSQWITGLEAREAGHALRATHDAILTGIGTVLADNPKLTCRLPGCESCSPIRIVLDAGLAITVDHALVKSANPEQPVWIFTSRDSVPPEHAETLKQIEGLRIVAGPETENGYLDLVFVVNCLADEGINRLLIEAGSAVSASFLQSDLVDEIVWFRAARLIGGDGKPAISDLGVDTLDKCIALTCISARQVGVDVMETYIVNKTIHETK